ncbi:MAG: hypothetical protein Homavirus20_3 [Homavirus sp.]|uniref:Uncharacterized protein n=1 Tax=Homavirus sp. TaxID=2487769 RepID=A0A3G5A4T2_9VIRU|nr:MAG: hypothetical protein Homavirus20_3 [Homavirus sp.]
MANDKSTTDLVNEINSLDDKINRVEFNLKLHKYNNEDLKQQFDNLCESLETAINELCQQTIQSLETELPTHPLNEQIEFLNEWLVSYRKDQRKCSDQRGGTQLCSTMISNLEKILAQKMEELKLFDSSTSNVTESVAENVAESIVESIVESELVHTQ